jgi:gliding motility-associated-like protein
LPEYKRSSSFNNLASVAYLRWPEPNTLNRALYRDQYIHDYRIVTIINAIELSLLKKFVVLLVILVSYHDMDAQLCQGSLGDPIVNITFGSGPNPGASLKAATTSYQYVGNDCPNDGFYTVRNNTFSCFSNSWHSLNSDHTGDPNGYFMLVNASFQPSAFYVDTVRGLCGNTTYEFAAWIANVLKPTSCSPAPIHPDLTFTLERTDGLVLQTYNTGAISMSPFASWKQYGFFFTMPANTSEVVVRIFNNAAGGCGNDLALDDITFRPCGPEISAGILGFARDTVVLCAGTAGNYTFTASISSGFNSPSLQWQQSEDGVTWKDIPGATGFTYNKNFPVSSPVGIYRYRLSAAEAGSLGSLQCRIASDPVAIDIGAIPTTAAISNGPVCQQSELTLTASGGATYTWTGGNNFSGSGATIKFDNAQPGLSGKYYVEVTSDKGCSQRDSVLVVVNPRPVLQVSPPIAVICEGQSIQLQGSGASDYQWQPAAGLSSPTISNPVASPADKTEYQLIAINEFQCRDTTVVTVNVMEAPRAFAGEDKWIIEGSADQLNGEATGQDISFTWLPDVFINDVNSLNPMVNPPRDTNYILKVASVCGEATDTAHVFVYKDVYVPNAFSPNNDGLNDTWRIPALTAYPEHEVTVFNRYGEIVFHNKNSTTVWDGSYKGKDAPVGVYVYKILIPSKQRLLKGTLTLIR